MKPTHPGVKATPLGRTIRQAGADGKLTFAEANRIAQTALKGNLTDAKIAQTRDFFAAPPRGLKAASDKNGVDALSGGSSLAQVLYWGMPRDLAGTRNSGQSFSEGVVMNAHQYFFKDRPAEPLQFHVHGTARKDYVLRFKIANTQLSVPIQKGMTAAQTASAVAKAIDQYRYTDSGNPQAQAFSTDANASKALHWPDSDAYPIGVGARAKGGTVLISPQIDS